MAEDIIFPVGDKRDELNLKKIGGTNTISQMVETINHNFEQIASHGGGPAGKDGESSIIPGPMGKRGNGLFIMNTDEMSEEIKAAGEKYLYVVNKALADDSSIDGEGKYKDGDSIIYNMFLYSVKNKDGVLKATIEGFLKGDKGDKGNDASGDDIYDGSFISLAGIGDNEGGILGYQFKSDRHYLVLGTVNEDYELYEDSDGNGILNGSHSLWVLDGGKGIALCDGNGGISTITYSDDGLVVDGCDDITLKGNKITLSTQNVESNNIDYKVSGKLGIGGANTITIDSIDELVLNSNKISVSSIMETKIEGDEVIISGATSNVGIHIGKNSPKGYYVGIDGNTHIKGDLEVSGNIYNDGLIPLGTIWMIPNTSQVPDGWLDNSTLPILTKIPLRLSSGGKDVILGGNDEECNYYNIYNCNKGLDLPDPTEFDNYASVSRMLALSFGTYSTPYYYKIDAEFQKPSELSNGSVMGTEDTDTSFLSNTSYNGKYLYGDSLKCSYGEGGSVNLKSVIFFIYFDDKNKMYSSNEASETRDKVSSLVDGGPYRDINELKDEIKDLDIRYSEMNLDGVDIQHKKYNLAIFVKVPYIEPPYTEALYEVLSRSAILPSAPDSFKYIMKCK